MFPIRERDLDLKSKFSGIVVSTVALCIEHDGDWYETMIFAADEHGEVSSYLELFCNRYATKADAEAGHEQVLSLLEQGVSVDNLYDKVFGE